jgi:valine--pyruvate aminotransferase
MKFSAFGNKFSQSSGIVTLMEDLGTALRERPDMCFMGGGNPAQIRQAEIQFQAALSAILADPKKSHQLFGVYQAPQGDGACLDALVNYLNNTFGWPITRRNIAISNGSQSAFYTLFNLFGGDAVEPALSLDEPLDIERRLIQLPLAPEYLGYADIGIDKTLFRAARPSIELLGEQQFKYHVDFNSLNLGEDVGAICVSRPTNPTGNVLTDDEIDHLQKLAEARSVPLIIDGAYGAPFPSIIYSEIVPHWTPNTILVLSLSKLGLPGVRTGIVIADEPIIEAFSRANTVLSLASGNLGPMLLTELLNNQVLPAMVYKTIRPFYEERAQTALGACQRYLRDVPCRVHKPEGAIFLWLWFDGLPITSQVLYERLKARGVLVVPGEHFFMGLDDRDGPWPHAWECIRVTYTQDPSTVEEGLRVIGEEVRALYAEGQR